MAVLRLKSLAQLPHDLSPLSHPHGCEASAAGHSRPLKWGAYAPALHDAFMSALGYAFEGVM
jgi:hypothetical protein